MTEEEREEFVQLLREVHALREDGGSRRNSRLVRTGDDLEPAAARFEQALGGSPPVPFTGAVVWQTDALLRLQKGEGRALWAAVAWTAAGSLACPEGIVLLGPAALVFLSQRRMAALIAAMAIIGGIGTAQDLWLNRDAFYPLR